MVAHFAANPEHWGVQMGEHAVGYAGVGLRLKRALLFHLKAKVREQLEHLLERKLDTRIRVMLKVP